MRMVYAVVDANGMRDGVHIRLMVTRGLKPTPFQDPRTTIGLPTIVVLAEYKAPPPAPRAGLRLATVHVRRGAPDVQDPNWNSHSKLNCIAACIAAAKAGADEALMLDPCGFVATCNSTNFLIVRDGELWAPTTKYQMPGITRGVVLRCAREAGIPVRECDFSLTAVYGADEAFVTGTFAGLLPVASVDGRPIGACTSGALGKAREPLLPKLRELYTRAMDEDVAHA
jgi:branched-chain amino acid aminotransferase